jgi:hypothetical protein
VEGHVPFKRYKWGLEGVFLTGEHIQKRPRVFDHHLRLNGLALLVELEADFELLSESLGVRRSFFGLQSDIIKSLTPAGEKGVKHVRKDVCMIRVLGFL